MASGDIYQCTCEMDFNNQAIVNVYHFLQIGADGTGDPRAALATIWEDNFEAPFLALISEQVTVDSLRIRRILPTQTQSFFRAIAEIGDIIGQPLPTNQVAVLRLYGVRAAGKGIGNMRIPGVDNVFVDEGQVNGSYVGIAELFGDEFEQSHLHVASSFTFRSCVLGTDDVARQVQRARMTSRIKQLRSRTVGQGA